MGVGNGNVTSPKQRALLSRVSSNGGEKLASAWVVSAERQSQTEYLTDQPHGGESHVAGPSFLGAV